MKFFPQITTIGVFILGLAAMAFSQPEVQAIYARGREHFNARRWDDAIREYTEVIRLRPDVAGVYHSRGLSHYNKKVSEPKKTYQELAVIESNLKPGEKAPKSQNSLNAIADFNKAIELKPGADSYASYYWRAQTYRRENDLEPAILDLRKFIQLYPNYEQDPNFKNAKLDMTKISNDYAEKLVTRGLYEVVMASYLDHGLNASPEQMKQYEDRMREIKVLFRTATGYYMPDNSFTHAGRARAYLQLDNFQAAVSDFEAAVKLTPNDANLVNELAGAYKRNNQFDKAIGVYTSILAMLETHASVKIQKNNALYRRAELHLDQNKLNEALADLNKLLTAVPTYQVAYFLRGRVYVKQGKKALARADFVKSSETSGLRKIAQIEIDKLDGKAVPIAESVKPPAPKTSAAAPLPAPVWRDTGTARIVGLPPSALGLNSPNGLRLLCRARFAGGVYPGIVLDNKCNFAAEGVERVSFFFEVYLTSDNPGLELLAKEGEKYAIGKAKDGTPVYLCYLKHENWWVPGRIVKDRCNFAWLGKELSSATFSYGYLAPAKAVDAAAKP